MAPVPVTFYQTPTRRPNSHGKLISISATNKLRFKPRSFKIPKCNVEGKKNVKKLRNKYRSPLLFLEEEYKEFSQSLEDLRPRQYDDAPEERREVPAPHNTPCVSVVVNSNMLRVSDSECDYFSFYHQEDDCNCKECETNIADWSEDSDDEDSSTQNNKETSNKNEDLGGYMNRLTITEGANSAVDSDAVGPQVPDLSFALTAAETQVFVFGEQSPDSCLHNSSPEMQIPDLVFNLHDFGQETTDFDIDMMNVSSDGIETPDSSPDINAVSMQIQNLQIRRNHPERVLLRTPEPIDELVIDLFPHETAESLLPPNFPKDVNYLFQSLQVNSSS